MKQFSSIVLLFFLLFVFSTLCPGTLSAEEPTASLYRIESIQYDITGKTLERMLDYTSELKKGREFSTKEELNAYLEAAKQKLINTRAFDSVEISSTELGNTAADSISEGIIPVEVLVKTVDTISIMAFPVPKIKNIDQDSTFALKYRDYNFLGTLQTLRVDAGLFWKGRKTDPDRNFGFNTLIDTNYPFKFLGLNWDLDFDNEFDYDITRPKKEALSYTNTTGVSAEIPFGDFKLTLGLAQNFYVNSPNNRRSLENGSHVDDYAYNPEYSANPDDDTNPYYAVPTNLPFYTSTKPSISMAFPVILDNPVMGDLYYDMDFSFNANYGNGKNPLLNTRVGPSVSFTTGPVFSNINWIDNFRSGMSADITAGFGYNFYKNISNPHSISLSASWKGHFILFDFWGISSRAGLSFTQGIEKAVDASTYGSYLRGINDSYLVGSRLLYLNVDLPFRVLEFRPADWWGVKWMRYLHFDLHLSPFIDIALVKGWEMGPLTEFTAKENLKLDLKDILMTAGFEFLFFPNQFKSTYLRLSVGWPLTTGPVSQDPRTKGDFMYKFLRSTEWFFGTGHAY
ncbi:MAG: hypothetical protein LBM77_11570 [Spirochaetaceae bacterium]|jgi:hypothetical protein|nr:hypothetical protein [Spirochaetaceae bacterium]